MLFDLPSFEALYRALLERDARYDGQAYVCVSTTGVFCRLACSARKPKAENRMFRATIGASIEAGFRACKRRHPLQAAAKADPAISTLLAALDARPDLRWSERQIVERGYDLLTVQRGFKRQFGMTFLEMTCLRRLRQWFEVLSDGGKVITAQHDAGFASARAFRAAFARLLGCATAALRGNGLLLASWINTPLGDMITISSTTHMHLLEFVDRKAPPAELKKLRAMAKQDRCRRRAGHRDRQLVCSSRAWIRRRRGNAAGVCPGGH